MKIFLSRISEMNTYKYLFYLIIILIIYFSVLISIELIFSSYEISEVKTTQTLDKNKNFVDINKDSISESIDSINVKKNDNVIKSNKQTKDNKSINDKTSVKKKNSFESMFYKEEEEKEFEKKEKIKEEKERKRKLALDKKKKRMNKKSEFITPDFIKKKKKKEKAVAFIDTIPFNRSKNITDNIIQTKRKSVTKCIKRSRVKFKELTGVIDYKVSINNFGKIIDIEIISSKWNSPKYGRKTEKCILKTMKYWKFPEVRNKDPYIIKSKFVF
jgi:hypothetical protein